MTNFEKIKSMSIEEMADFLCNIETDVANGTPIFTCCLGNNIHIAICDNYGDVKKLLESEVE